MGLNPRGRGRGRGSKGSFVNKPRRIGGMGGHGPMFRGNPMGMFCSPPMGFPPEPPFGPPFFPGPSGFNFGPPRPAFGKFPRKNFKRKIPQNSNETSSVPEIDLTKPWVTDEIKSEEAKKQECLEVWRKSKNDSDWNIYKSQKKIVQNLYDKAKAEYLENHPEEARLWQYVHLQRKHYCETCDKSFKSEEDLIFHEKEHEICGRDGCTYTAHPKIIARHIKMQHDSGLYKRIGKLYTKDEIANWIEERKKRYPSKKVIEEKKILEAEKIKRGEKIKDNSKFYKNSDKKHKNRKNKNNKVPKFKKIRLKKKNYLTEISVELKAESQRNGIPRFDGIKNFKFKEHIQKKADDNISDDEWYTPCNAESLSTPILNKSLSLLASIYDSEEETVALESQKENKDSEITDEENSAPVEVKTILRRGRQDLEVNLKEEKLVANKKKVLQEKFLQRKKKHTNIKNEFTKSTLLEKLLSKEIKHERNIILQCVHYVVSNNFFV